jgi:hypothetical protein
MGWQLRKPGIVGQGIMAKEGRQHPVDVEKAHLRVAHGVLHQPGPPMESLGPRNIRYAERFKIEPWSHASGGQLGWRLLMNAPRPSQAAPSIMFFAMTAAESS